MLSLPPSMVAPRVCGDDLKGHWRGVSSSAFRLSWFELHYDVVKSARVQQNRTTLAAFLALDITKWPFDIRRRGGGRRHSLHTGAGRHADRTFRHSDCSAGTPERRAAGDGEWPRIWPRARTTVR